MPGEMADQNIKAKKAGANNFEEKPVGARRKKRASAAQVQEVKTDVTDETTNE